MSETCDLLCLDLENAERLRQGMHAADDVTRVATRAKGLSDPTRVALALALSEGGELCVCDLAWIVERDDRLVSHHLRSLRSAGLVTSRRDGKMILYSLAPDAEPLIRAIRVLLAA